MRRIAVLFILILTLAITLILGAASADDGVLTLPADTVIIGEQAFYGTDAEIIILPEGVTSIGNGAFGGSQSLRKVYVPYSLMDRG